MNVSKQLKNTAISLGICKEHADKWDNDWTTEDLVNYFMTNPNWCLKRHFPSHEILKRNFNNTFVQSKGVFVDSDVTLRAVDSSYVFLNCRSGIITKDVCRLYFGIGGVARIIVESNGYLTVDVYDDVDLDIELRDNSSKLVVFQYGDRTPKVKGKNFKIVKK